MVECVTPPTNEMISAVKVESVEELFDYEFIIKCDVDRFVSEDARNIQVQACRDAEYQAKIKSQTGEKKIKKLRPFDALHVATALIENADYLFTYDQTHMMPLNGHRMVSGLNICKPLQLWDGGQLDIDDIPEETKPPRRMIDLDDEE